MHFCIPIEKTKKNTLAAYSVSSHFLYLCTAFNLINFYMERHYLDYFESSVVNYWDYPALSDYKTDINLTFGELAIQIEKLHLMFKEAGIQKGDKIALCGRNISHWAVGFLAVTTYEAVAVSIMDAFTPESVHHLVNHSDARMFLVGDLVWPNLDIKEMPALEAVISLKNFEPVFAKDEKVFQKLSDAEALFKAAHPSNLTKEDIHYPQDNWDDLVLINYTSGTTSDPKGVMLTNRSISSNIQFACEHIPHQPGSSVVSMLPLAHMFGLAFECLFQLCSGCHVYFLGKTPSPQVLMGALAEAKPYMILTVPLVVEKIFNKSIFPAINKPLVKMLWYTPGINRIIRRKVHKKLLDAFGGKLQYLIIGGAALNRAVELCLHQIKFPFCVGYGMTECGPLLGYESWTEFRMHSCGRIVDRMEILIDSDDPHKKVGEILVRGANQMIGYYKNEEATAAVFTQDGWLHTGDLGLLDEKNNIYIRGRNKSMILGPSGQNIYPEEIEDKLNNLQFVQESIVVSRNDKLVALVFPNAEDLNAVGGIFTDEMKETTKRHLNRMLPAFCRISSIEIVDKEFAKTPKRSIKRFLYS